ncbi:hypothetical protein ACH5RR_020855 [Cinchona calisaya]|uniref:Exocyst subunit Exo70 family protein n=1 Tax=Cinchona calisaya TaxID=153742 RepID=A0ABD2ZFP9_9GENT
MFMFIDMYEAVSDLWGDVEMVFSFDSLWSYVSSGDVTLSQFESAIEKDSSKMAVPACGAHPFTCYVMNYIVFLTDYSRAVADIVGRLCSWVIPDWKLRVQIKASLSKKMVPAYRAFHERHRKEIGEEAIVRYAPEDLKNYLLDLFYGNGEVLGSSRMMSGFGLRI